MNIYTEMMALLKPNENEEFIKSGPFLIREGFLIKGMSEVIDEWQKEGMAHEVLEMFL